MQPVCWLDRRALREVLQEGRRWHLRETGGALLGWTERNEYVVAQALGPGPRAKHGLTYFEPDGDWQVTRGHEIYFETGRTVAYLGDWHSHPWSSPVPSRRDRETARQIAEDPAFRTPQPLYGIAGLNRRSLKRYMGLVIYVWRDGTLAPARVVLFDALPR